jgi:Glycosyl transferases group 1
MPKSIKKLVQIPICEELQNILVMKQVFTEFTEGFGDYGCEVKITDIEHLENGGIICLDNMAGNYYNNKDLYIKISEKCPDSIFICWYWDIQPYFTPFHKIIYTGEFHITPNYLDKNRCDYFNLPNFVPLRLRANERPSLIGLYPRRELRDYCFMGGGYKKDWVPSEFTGIYHQVYYDNYLAYNVRRDIYLSSTFAFGFQSDENIRDGHLSQRIFEGLAYGCVVLCENKTASEFTDGAVVYISSKEDLIEKMKYYKENPEQIVIQQQKGYEWVRKYGTNRYSISYFLDKIKELYNEEFEI